MENGGVETSRSEERAVLELRDLHFRSVGLDSRSASIAMLHVVWMVMTTKECGDVKELVGV